MIGPPTLDAIARRKRWERDVLRDGMAQGHYRAPPGKGWMPAQAVLKRARRFLAAGGAEPRGRDLAAAMVQPGRLTIGADVRGGDVEALARAASERSDAALAVATDAFVHGGDGAAPGRARAEYAGLLVLRDFPRDELDLALAAAQGADAIIAPVELLRGELAQFVRVARCYALSVIAEADEPRGRDEAVVAGVEALLLPAPSSGERFERLAMPVPGFLPVVAGRGVRRLADARRVRRAGADGALVDPAAAAAPPEAEPDPLGDAAAAAEQDGDVLEDALAMLAGFGPAATGSGLLLPIGFGGVAPPTAPPKAESEEEDAAWSALSARGPRGLRGR